MELEDIKREMYIYRTLAKRDEIILNLSGQVTSLQKMGEEKDRTISDLNRRIAEQDVEIQKLKEQLTEG